MAILVVKIDDPATLRMNEFFDYAGHCWALSRSRDDNEAVGAELEDFYEGTVRSGSMEKVPVVFVCEDQIVGWYLSATVYRYIRHPSLFMEGNICADTRDARLLKQPVPAESMDFSHTKNYLVIENGDMRYRPLRTLIYKSSGPFEKIDYAKAAADPRAENVGRRDRLYGLMQRCEVFASEIMDDRCQGIGTVKALAQMALEVTRLDVSQVNGWYYLAMAYYQIGLVRKGLKAIDRAIRLEPDGDDLLVMKGNLLVSNGYLEEALRCYEEAYEINPDESYYVMAGKACACMSNPVAAQTYYQKVKDPKILEAFEIHLGKKKHIEKGTVQR